MALACARGGSGVDAPTCENSDDDIQEEIDALVDDLVAVGVMDDNDALTADDDIFDSDELTSNEEFLHSE